MRTYDQASELYKIIETKYNAFVLAEHKHNESTDYFIQKKLVDEMVLLNQELALLLTEYKTCRELIKLQRNDAPWER